MTNKNTGHFQAFDESWFSRNQRALLWLMNAPLVSLWFRWVLRIRNGDRAFDAKIDAIAPNSFTFDGHWRWSRCLIHKNGRISPLFGNKEKIEFNRHARRSLRKLGYVGDEWRFVWIQTTDFRTHPKFAKRVYYAFRPLWWAMHFWDWLVADRMAPSLSFGFSTLTAYPEAGYGTYTCDGYTERYQGYDGTLSDMRAGSGTYSNQTSENIQVGIVTGSSANSFRQIDRGLTMFKTDAITATATISEVIASVFVNAWSNNLGGAPALHAAQGNPGSDTYIDTSDYNQSHHGTTSFGNIPTSSVATSAYNQTTFNASGIAATNKTGITRISWQNNWDIANSFDGTWTSFKSSSHDFVSADYTGTSRDPKLVVTYTSNTIYTLAASPASFALTAKTIGNYRTVKVPAAAASYILTARTMGAYRKLTLVASAASYALTAATIGMKRVIKIIAAQASFALTGSAIGAYRNLILAATKAAYALTGLSASFGNIFNLAADAASFVLTGADMRITKFLTLAASKAEYALTGASMAFRRNFVAPASAASYALTGMAVGLHRIITLAASAASYALTMSAMTMTKVFRLIAAPASYSLIGKYVESYLNGISLLWRKASAAVSSWTKRSENQSAWTKKQDNSSDWTKRQDPPR